MSTSAGTALRALRDLARAAADGPIERCEICALPLGATHDHLVAPGELHVRCACGPCALVLGAEGSPRFRRVVSTLAPLDRFVIDDADWAGLGVPVRLVFLSRSSGDGAARPIAIYPGTLGPVGAPVDHVSWANLASENPMLETLAADVEGVLLDHTRGRRRAFRASIDVVFELAAIVRIHFKGLHGGDEGWAQVDAFLDGFTARGARG